jgi:hypothetical protein
LVEAATWLAIARWLRNAVASAVPISLGAFMVKQAKTVNPNNVAFFDPVRAVFDPGLIGYKGLSISTI